MNADDIAKELKERKKALWKELKDKIRTMSLGALAVIWALLTRPDSTSSLSLSRGTMVLLTDAGIFIVLALATDIIGIILDYLANVQFMEETFLPKINFRSMVPWANRSNVVGAAGGLIVLCVAVAGITISQLQLLRAQVSERSYEAFHGYWCTGSVEAETFRCVRIQPVTNEGGIITFKRLGQNLVGCVPGSGNENEITFRCQQVSYDLKRTRDPNVVSGEEGHEQHLFRKFQEE